MKIFLLLAFCAFWIFTNAQGNRVKNQVGELKRLSSEDTSDPETTTTIAPTPASSYPTTAPIPSVPIRENPDRYPYGSEYEPYPRGPYFEMLKDVIQRSLASMFDRSYLCMAPCLEPAVENAKLQVSLASQFYMPKSQLVSTILDVTRVVCGARDKIENCTNQCPRGPARTAVRTVWPLYENFCFELSVLRKDMACIVSSFEIAIAKFPRRCLAHSLDAKAKAFGHMMDITDFMQAVKNHSDLVWEISNCLFEGFRDDVIVSQCKKDTILSIDRILVHLRKVECDILDQFGVPEDKIPKACKENVFYH